MVTSTARSVRAVIAEQQLHTVNLDAIAADAAKLMQSNKLGAVVVVDGERLAGIFTERDALFRIVAEGLDPSVTPIADVMTPDPTTIHPDKSFDHALELMHAGQFRHLPVVEDERTIGMVSSLDAMGEELEQFMYAIIVQENNRDILA